MTAASEPQYQLYLEIKGAKHPLDFDDYTIAELEEIEELIGGPIAEAPLTAAKTRVALAAAALLRLNPRSTFAEQVDEVRELKAGEIAVGVEDIAAAEEKPAGKGKRPTKPAAEAAEPEPAGTQD